MSTMVLLGMESPAIRLSCPSKRASSKHRIKCNARCVKPLLRILDRPLARAMTVWMSKLHAVGTLQAQNLARLLRGGDLIAEFLDQAPHLGDLLGVALGELAAADIEAVLEPDADIAAHHHGLGGERNLETAGAQHRPLIVVAEQLVGGALHEHEIVDVGA